jgi:hypothetical protein
MFSIASMGGNVSVESKKIGARMFFNANPYIPSQFTICTGWFQFQSSDSGLMLSVTADKRSLEMRAKDYSKGQQWRFTYDNLIESAVQPDTLVLDVVNNAPVLGTRSGVESQKWTIAISTGNACYAIARNNQVLTARDKGISTSSVNTVASQYQTWNIVSPNLKPGVLIFKSIIIPAGKLLFLALTFTSTPSFCLN